MIPTTGPGTKPGPPALHPFAGLSAWSLLELRSSRSGERPFMVWQPFDGEPVVWTYAEFARVAAAVGVGLTARGVKAGDHVLIHLENCPEFLLTWFGCAAIGAVAVTTNTRSAADEVRYFAEHSRAVAAITQPRFAALIADNAPDLRWIVSLDHDSGVDAGQGRRPDPGSAFGSLVADAGDLTTPPPDPSAPLSVMYTSGTTSRPKGVVCTHANALWAASAGARYETLLPTDRHLTYAPLFHANAMVFSVLPTLWVGGTFVLLPKWSTSRFWDLAIRHGTTWMSLLGPAVQLLTRDADAPPDGHSFRMFGTGGCDLPFDAVYGVKTIGWWGMTETCGAPIVGDAHLPNRPTSMGRPAPGYGIAVVRDGGGTSVEPDEPGHLLVKGTPGLSLFAGYLDDPAATAGAFDESGWFRTGDIVIPHADGHLSFADRSKDMLKVGGENVAASEVERVILTVAGVVEAAVVGRPDDWLDEVPVAFVIAPGSDEGLADRVRAACRSMVADFKAPRAVYVVDELPRSTLRKVDKVELRAVAHSDADRSAAERRWVEEAKLDPSGDAA